MKKKKQILLSVTSLIVLGFCSIPTHAGDLEPAAPPGPTMKPLDIVEPRTPVSALPFTIDTPGSYYLTANLIGSSGLDGITIETDDVTLDLNGFTLTGVAGSLDGIKVLPDNPIPFPRQNLKVHNGAVRNWGGGGVTGETLLNAQFSDLRIFNNGGHGIAVGPACQVRRCFVKGNIGSGIRQVNLYGLIEDNEVTGNGIGLDIVGTEPIVRNNVVRGNGDNYIFSGTARIDLLLCEIPETIDFSCHVKLVGNLFGTSGQNGITIGADDITIDLNGFTLTGGPGSLEGITIPFAMPHQNLTVQNGTIREFENGVTTSSVSKNVRVANVQIFECRDCGMILRNSGSLVKDCTANDNVGVGIFLADDSMATANIANANGSQGIQVGSQCLVSGNVANNNGGSGIIMGGVGGTVIGNVACNNQNNGISVSFGNNFVHQNSAINNDQSGSGSTNISACGSCTFGTNHAPPIP
jgi:hypothetical protein